MSVSKKEERTASRTARVVLLAAVLSLVFLVFLGAVSIVRLVF